MDFFESGTQKMTDAIRKPLGLKKPNLPPVTPQAAGAQQTSQASAAQSIRGKKRKGVAASVLSGQDDSKRNTLG